LSAGAVVIRWLVLGLLLLGAVPAAAATRYDPRLRFRTISTARFDIHFHQGEEALARRLAGFVEAAAAEVDAAVGAAVGRIQVILVDQNDLSNGWATPVPYNTIEITAAPPPAESAIGNTGDWLRLVFVHEYAHIAHLSRAGGWIQGLRRGFGRLPPLFPNLYQPIWAIEGLATWQESRVTHEGRVRAGDFRLWLDRAAAARRLEPIDRANGGNVDWPGGNGPYLYGAYFHEYLSERFGADAVKRVASETGRRLPYLGSRAYKKVFGRSLGQLWKEFEQSVESAVRADSVSRSVRLTRQGFRVSTPRLRTDGHLFYSSVTPHGFPALMELAADGSSRTVTTRYLGGAIAFAGDHLVVDELELARSTALRSDIVLVDPRTGHRRQLTHEARAADPDAARDGTVVCTVQMADRRALATFTVPATGAKATPRIIISEPGVDFAVPRWSPDGRMIAAERRQRGGASTIALVDAVTRTVRTIASLPGGRAGSPVWTPDGAAVLFSAAVGDDPFRIYRVAPATGAVSRLEGTGGSAQSPEVAPDGRRVVFVGYTADGYDLFSLDLAGAEWTPMTTAQGDAPVSFSAEADAPPDRGRTYSPWPTLRPTFWTPTLESDAGELVVGAATGSADALGRHAYGAEAGWSARARPDWRIGYAYDRWRPTLFAAVADDTDPWREGTVRTRELDAGLLLPFQRVRSSQSVLASVHAAADDYECAGCETPVSATIGRRSLRGGYSFSNAHTFGYSISAEEGLRASITAEASRARIDGTRAGRERGTGIALTVDVRKYQALGPRHAVLAVRGAAARFWGDAAAEQEFSASGNGPQLSGLGFGSDAIGLLRGFREDAISGTRAAVVNLDYRVPLLRIDRGAGTIPLFVRSIHGAVFADAGHAWRGAPRWRDVSASFGAEQSADTIVGFALPVTMTGGVALRRDGAVRDRDVVVFGRIGRAF
jgi:hypothetical protein